MWTELAELLDLVAFRSVSLQTVSFEHCIGNSHRIQILASCFSVIVSAAFLFLCCSL